LLILLFFAFLTCYGGRGEVCVLVVDVVVGVTTSHPNFFLLAEVQGEEMVISGGCGEGDGECLLANLHGGWERELAGEVKLGGDDVFGGCEVGVWYVVGGWVCVDVVGSIESWVVLWLSGMEDSARVVGFLLLVYIVVVGGYAVSLRRLHTPYCAPIYAVLHVGHGVLVLVCVCVFV
jgi:hypothetical protein